MSNDMNLKEAMTNYFEKCDEPMHDLRDMFKIIDILNGFDGRVPIYQENEDGVFELVGYDEDTN